MLFGIVFVLMQVTAPNPATVLQGPSLSPPAVQSTAPAPATTETRTVSGGTTVNVMPATDDEIAHDATIAAPAGMDGGATVVNTGLNKLATQSLQLPQYLLTRDKNIILNNPTVLSLNTSLRYVGLAVWVLCLGLVVAKHLAGPFVGADIMNLSYALPVAMFMGMLGWFNQELLGIIIDLVGAVISSVVAAPLSQAITPGLSFNTGSQLIIGPVLGVLYDLMSIWLIFKLWLQIAWLWILTTVAPIYITATGAPFLGKYGSHWWHNWMGTMVDPILVVVGLKLVVPWFDLMQGAPPLASEATKILILFVMASGVGWHQGAYRPQSPEMLLLAAAYRLMRHNGSHPATHTALPALQPAQPPNYVHAVSPMNKTAAGGGGTGGGTAASWWKTRAWATAGNGMHP